MSLAKIAPFSSIKKNQIGRYFWIIFAGMQISLTIAKRAQRTSRQMASPLCCRILVQLRQPIDLAA
jgi:hypothetical protein